MEDKQALLAKAGAAALSKKEKKRLVHVLRDRGFANAEIARMLDLSVNTVKKYQSEAVEQFEEQDFKQFLSDAWQIIHSLNKIVKERVTLNPDGFTVKEAALVSGIYFDKVIEAIRKTRQGESKAQVIQFNFFGGESESREEVARSGAPERRRVIDAGRTAS